MKTILKRNRRAEQFRLRTDYDNRERSGDRIIMGLFLFTACVFYLYFKSLLRH